MAQVSDPEPAGAPRRPAKRRSKEKAAEPPPPTHNRFVELAIVEARNLQLSDNGRGPYVELAIGDYKARTQKTRADPNPVWREDVTLHVENEYTALLLIGVWQGSKKQCLGKYTLNLGKLWESRRMENTVPIELWVPLLRRAEGGWVPVEGPSPPELRLGITCHNLRRMQDAVPAPAAEEPRPIRPPRSLQVKVIKGVQLESGNDQGLMRPFVELVCGGQRHVTTAGSERDWLWNEQFAFPLTDDIPVQLSVAVRHEGGPAFGKQVFVLTQLPRGQPVSLAVPLLYQDGQQWVERGESQVILRLTAIGFGMLKDDFLRVEGVEVYVRELVVDEERQAFEFLSHRIAAILAPSRVRVTQTTVSDTEDETEEDFPRPVPPVPSGAPEPREEEQEEEEEGDDEPPRAVAVPVGVRSAPGERASPEPDGSDAGPPTPTFSVSRRLTPPQQPQPPAATPPRQVQEPEDDEEEVEEAGADVSEERHELADARGPGLEDSATEAIAPPRREPSAESWQGARLPPSHRGSFQRVAAARSPSPDAGLLAGEEDGDADAAPPPSPPTESLRRDSSLASLFAARLPPSRASQYGDQRDGGDASLSLLARRVAEATMEGLHQLEGLQREAIRTEQTLCRGAIVAGEEKARRWAWKLERSRVEYEGFLMERLQAERDRINLEAESLSDDLGFSLQSVESQFPPIVGLPSERAPPAASPRTPTALPALGQLMPRPPSPSSPGGPTNTARTLRYRESVSLPKIGEDMQGHPGREHVVTRLLTELRQNPSGFRFSPGSTPLPMSRPESSLEEQARPAPAADPHSPMRQNWKSIIASQWDELHALDKDYESWRCVHPSLQPYRLSSKDGHLRTASRGTSPRSSRPVVPIDSFHRY